MATAVLANRNDTSLSTTSFHRHQQSHKSMGKSPFINPNPNRNNFNYNAKQPSHLTNNNGTDQLKLDDTASFNSFSHCVNFDISTYSKADLRKLKSQLISELEKVRNLSSRIESKKRSSPFPPENGNNVSKRFAPNEKKQYQASAPVMKLCSTVLRKLSNQKAGIWFNSPVDAIGMGLHDYHTVIDRPMDLGTVKDRLDKGFYETPEEFASDVRLTFNNALRYNPKGHEVNTFAGQYLALFERWFPPIVAKFHAEKQLHYQQLTPKVVDDDVPCKLPSPEPAKVLSPVKKPEFKPESKLEMEPTLRREASPVVERSGGGRGRLPKPKAKDPNKREMSMDEKHKLGAGLQNLPEEKMLQVIQIIRKRNGDLTQDGDEIELDIEAVDKETLWELDRFVTNYNKMVSKIKRQALMGSHSNNLGHSDDTNVNQGGMGDRMAETSSKAKKGGGGGGDVGEEDVDIGDEMPVNNFPPLEIDKDDDKHSSSSSSSSGSDDSSSSDSDSGSSSGSDSDVDDAQSRDNESKNIHH